MRDLILAIINVPCERSFAFSLASPWKKPQITKHGRSLLTSHFPLSYPFPSLCLRLFWGFYHARACSRFIHLLWGPFPAFIHRVVCDFWLGFWVGIFGSRSTILHQLFPDTRLFSEFTRVFCFHRWPLRHQPTSMHRSMAFTRKGVCPPFRH